MEIKKLPVAFTGSGDLFASLILSWMHKTENDLKLSLENTVASLQSVLVRTIEAMQGKYKYLVLDQINIYRVLYLY